MDAFEEMARQARISIRNAALEEAAKTCENLPADDSRGDYAAGTYDGRAECAEAIRALKSE